MVPFLDARAAYFELRQEINEGVRRAISSGQYVGGLEVEAFERDWAAHCGADHAVGVGNGLDALELTLRALDVGAGDEVITASNGFIATLLAISATGAKPVLVEPDPHTHTLDPAKVEAAITVRTRALLPTHLYGHPADLSPLLAIARAKGLALVEDAAQAHGAAYKGKRIGAHGDAVCWSFYPSKNLGALGDAGAVTTNDRELAYRIRRYGNYGASERYIHQVHGRNSRLDPIQAAVLRAKLPLLDKWNERRRRIADFYRASIGDNALILPEVAPWADPVWHLFVIRHPDRDAFSARLRAANIETLIHYPVPPHLQAAYLDLGLSRGSLPIAEQLAGEILSLPIGPHLSAEQASLVAEAVCRLA